MYFSYVDVTFQLSEADYREMEGPDAMMPVIIAKASDVFIATDVTFMIIPLTVQQALDRGVIDDFPMEDIFNPNRAGFSTLFSLNHHTVDNSPAL